MQMTRRDFLRSAAMSAALAAVAGPAGVARAAEANTPEKWVKGVCRYCGTGCGVLVGSNQYASLFVIQMLCPTAWISKP